MKGPGNKESQESYSKCFVNYQILTLQYVKVSKKITSWCIKYSTYNVVAHKLTNRYTCIISSLYLKFNLYRTCSRQIILVDIGRNIFGFCYSLV